MDKTKYFNGEPIQTFRVDNILIGFNPETNTKLGKSSQSLTMDFNIENDGYIRVRLDADICELFDKIYHQQTNGRLKK